MQCDVLLSLYKALTARASLGGSAWLVAQFRVPSSPTRAAQRATRRATDGGTRGGIEAGQYGVRGVPRRGMTTRSPRMHGRRARRRAVVVPLVLALATAVLYVSDTWCVFTAPALASPQAKQLDGIRRAANQST